MTTKAEALVHAKTEHNHKFAIGDNVRVHVKIKEGGKERIQVFAGTVIARKGRKATETFTVRRVTHGVGVERGFPINSPNVTKVEIESTARMKRSKLYYMRGLSGKQARLKRGAGERRSATGAQS